MKKVLWVLSSLALVGMGFVGCDDEDKDACDNKCEDGQVCALVRDGAEAYKCMAKASIDASCLNGDVFREGKILVKDGADWLCENNETTHTNTCVDDNGCSKGQKCHPIDKVCVDPSTLNIFKYVRIDDASSKNQGKGWDPGADIDAVVLIKKGSASPIYATKLVAYARGDGKAKSDGKAYAADPNKAIGKPDSLIHYGESTDADVCYYYKDGSDSAGKPECDSDNDAYCGGKDTCGCDFDYTFVSLGGQGGYITLEMGGAIEAGDKLDIIELGNCKLSNTGSKAGVGSTTIGSNGTEDMKVSVSVSDATGAVFKELGTGHATAGVYSLTISENSLK